MSKVVAGFNPVRHDCRARGCYLATHHPPIELFASALPRKISMQDIDATVEVNGNFLFLEWKKGEPHELPAGQRIYAQRLTGLSRKITFAAVAFGDEPRDVRHVSTIYGGQVNQWTECDFDMLHERVARWAACADIGAAASPAANAPARSRAVTLSARSASSFPGRGPAVPASAPPIAPAKQAEIAINPNVEESLT